MVANMRTKDGLGVGKHDDTNTDDAKNDDAEPYSAVVQELTGAQGTLAVISALLASFAFGGLTCVDADVTSSSNPIVVGVYYVVTR